MLRTVFAPLLSLCVWSTSVLAIEVNPSVAQDFNASPSFPLQPPLPSGLAEEPYRLGPGDQLSMKIFRLPDYSGTFNVLVDGTVMLPSVGTVSVAGLTLPEATETIAARYAGRLRRPIVDLSLISLRPLQVGIAGEVQRPGTYSITPTGTSLPSITQFLQQAGGILMTANLQEVILERQEPNGVRQIQLNLQTLLETGNAQANITLRDGDTIFIPATISTDLSQLSYLVNASFVGQIPDVVNVAVIGEVFRPGSHTVTATTRTGKAGTTGNTTRFGRFPTVTGALEAAGGIQATADVRQVKILRPTRSGADQVIQVNLWKLLESGDVTQDAVLQEGDTVIVPKATTLVPEEASQLAVASFAPSSITVHIVGEVVRPGEILIPPNTPLNQALLTAGGFSTRSRRNSVQFIRLNSDGSVASRNISIDLETGANDETNPILQNNDIVLVGRSAFTQISDTLDSLAGPLARFFTIFSTPINLFNILNR
ncbi:MAG: SLBB domain-containing protein [Prochlorotrichaceae cyanobacterium]